MAADESARAGYERPHAGVRRRELVAWRAICQPKRAMADGTWPRLKACAAHNCEWAFYDTSKNRSRTWCNMAVCGNREKARAYRQRQRAGE